MTDQQIDEFLEMLAKSPTSARDMVRGLFAAHEAKAAPAVPQCDLASVTEIETVIDWCVTSYMPMPSNEHAALLVDRLRHLRATPAAPSQPVNRPQNCGTSFCSCIECVCEPEPVTLTDDEIDANTVWFDPDPHDNVHCDVHATVNKCIAALREKEQTK